MQHKLTNFFIWFFVIFMFSIPFLAEYSYVIEDTQINPFDYARITEVEYKAVVVDEPDSRGKVVITERLTFDIHAASKDNLFWELWRELPETYVDGVKVEYKVNSVKQILDDDTEVIYDESPKLYWDDSDYVNTNPYYGPEKWYHSEGPYDEDAAQYECVFFYVDGLYREEVVFEIEYEMYNAALRYNDCSDLYLSLYSGSTISHLESFEAEILFPEKDMPAKGNYNVYTYGTNANEFPVKESATKNPGYYTFSFDLDEDELKFRPYNKYIEFDLVSYNEDKHIFTEYAPSNYYSSDDVLDEIFVEQEAYASTPDRFKKLKTTVLICLSASGICALLYVLTADSRKRAKYTFYTPTVEMDFYREVPGDLDPNFAAALVFCKHKPRKDDSGVYSAILLSLARKGYIDIQQPNSVDAQIKITKSPSGIYEPLTLCEEYYFNLLIRHTKGNDIWMSDFQKRVSADYANTDAFARNMKNSIVNIGVKDGYFQKADYTQPQKQLRSMATFFRVIGILSITLVNIISYQTRMDFAYGAFTIFGIICILSAFVLKRQSGKYVLLTQFGEDEYAKWRGFYNFLNSDTLIHERTVIELPLWERYLVYAAAFGLSEKVIKATSIRCPETTSSPILDNHYYRSSSFHRSGSSFRSSVRTGSSITYSGGGGGFGYGGGGRGGGGGGGGH